MYTNPRTTSIREATDRAPREINLPKNEQGEFLKISDYYGINVFDIKTTSLISDSLKREVLEVSHSGKKLSKENAQTIAKAAMDWAKTNGATHFCHWFQPLTGATAEKHDSFLTFDDQDLPIEKLSSSQLMQGEPDASSFPNGGSRSTFEARGYTSWDMSSPMFLTDGSSGDGKTLCIPTAFVSYNGDALDIKTPLLRSITKLSNVATKFLNLIGAKDVTSVTTNAGPEQEYFLVDKSFYYCRPDLVMTGRTLFGSISSRNQQLDDHYFGTIPERVLSFMQELDLELHKLGIPSKTRHNEVAPGQFEIAPIFREANVATDQNQILMAVIKNVAERHSFIALLHEKPFAGINGSGKHINWSMSDNNGLNLFEPGKDPSQNNRFLAMVAMTVEAVNRHAEVIRSSISGHGNDHRLGANEAPPSIISVFLGDTLDKIFKSILAGKTFTSSGENTLDIGAEQLSHLLKDNTDRNRTSPFAFTGNRFEFRAVGSSQNIGLPLSILNTAMAEVMEESNVILEKDIKGGMEIDTALTNLIRKWMGNSGKVVFNGDGYSDAWIKEAASRGLPNLKTTADALKVLTDPTKTAFLSRAGIFSENELLTRHNVLTERYVIHREIEFNTMIKLIHQYVLPAGFSYKEKLGNILANEKSFGVNSGVDNDIYKKLTFLMDSLYFTANDFNSKIEKLHSLDDVKVADKIANELLPISEVMAQYCIEIEELVPAQSWALPSYYDMLFLR
jgi:glutamine synthetase